MPTPPRRREPRATPTRTAVEMTTQRCRSPTSICAPRLLAALDELGYEEPTPIQAAAIPPMLAGGDLLGQAATGTGKTAAFALPILDRLEIGRGRRTAPSALVLVPTRELAMQVSEAIFKYGRAPRREGRADLRWPTDLPPAAAARPWRRCRRRHSGPRSRPRGPRIAPARRRRDRRARRGRRDARHGIRRRLGDHPPVDTRGAPDGAVLGHAARHASTPSRSAISATRSGSRSAAPTRSDDKVLVRQRAYVVQRAHKAAALGRILDVESPDGDDRVLPHPRRGRPADGHDERARLPRRSPPRRHGPDAARPGDGAAS